MARAPVETRGSYYGIKAKPLARRTEASLLRMRAKILKLQEPWAEADMMVESATTEAVRALDALIKQYKDSAEYLSEPME